MALLFAACSSGGDGDDGAASASTTTASTIPVSELQSDASRITDLLIAGKYDDVISHLNAEMLLSMSSQNLKTAWEQLTTQFGAYKSRGTTARSTTAAPQGIVVFDTPMQFAKAAMKSRVSFDRDGKVASLLVLKADVA